MQGPTGRTLQKGHLEFCGAAIIERLEMVVQRDPQSSRTFPNLVVDLAVIDLADRDDSLDWRWIVDRRDPGRSAAEQRPDPGTPEADLLTEIYTHFDTRKHAFEHLAATVAGQVFEGSGSQYQRGWLTRAGGDGGMDFVGRLDAGSAQASTPLVVLGQAKCIKPTSSISPDEVARVVARLRRGWIGVFVTTGAFSKQAQVEVIDDAYPVVLIPGGMLVREAIKLAERAFDGDVAAALEAASQWPRSTATREGPNTAEVSGPSSPDVLQLQPEVLPQPSQT